VTRRAILGKGIAAGMAALGLGALARPSSILAKANPPKTKRDPSREYNMVVFYDKNGKAIKVCYYDQSGKLLYCDSV
ncbi:MAG: hypothetical protein H0V24_03785, partial [Chloroflexia bacterium]|nr:hypothetical protein [Chloroflexia bacterium]